MRVLMVSYTSLLQRGYRRKCDAICREGDVDLTLLTPPYWREPWSQGRRVRFEPQVGGEPYRSVVVPVWFAGNGHLAFFRGQVGHLLETFRPDVIDLEREPWSWAAGQMLWLRNRRCRGARLVFHASQNALKWYPPPFRQIERAVYRQADGALARSRGAAAVLRARGFRGRLRVIPHGVDTGLFSPVDAARRDREPVVGFVGALTRQKGVDVLLRAVARIQPPTRCLVVGDGPERACLGALARALGIEARVDFRGPVPHQKVPEFLNRMTVFALPAVSLPGLAERFGRVLLEAMAAGVPVVGSDSGEIPNIVGDAGFVVPEGDPAALARALEEVLGEGGKALELADRARRRVERHYSWDVVARQTLEVYREVLGGTQALRAQSG